MNAILNKSVIAEIKKQEYVSRANALAALLVFTDNVPSHHALSVLSEIDGVAATCDDPEMIRKFIVFAIQHGPLMKD